MAEAPIDRKKQKKNTLHTNVATIHGWPVSGASTANHTGNTRKKLRIPQPPKVTRLKPKCGKSAVAATCTGVSKNTNEYANPT